MDRTLTVKRRAILAGLGVLLLADVALSAYSLHAANAVRRPMAMLVADSRKLQLLNADIERAEKIRHDLPATVADCDRFEATLVPASAGNSAIVADLDELAKKAGLQIQAVNFAHKVLPQRNLTEVELNLSVSGEYSNIVRFMNGLQRSRSNYAVETVTLQPEAQSGPTGLRIGLHIKTYFRTAA
jgi:type IV pilus assembly protein PilO